MSGHPLLRLTGVTKSFAGVQALRGASFELRAGEVHALLGENGAGKSTLIRIVTGALRPDGGEILLAGDPVRDHSPRAARERGIAAIYQQPALFPELTVSENIALASEPARPWRRVDWRARRKRAEELLARVGARIDPEVEAGELSMPQQQLVEIARALGTSARVLIFDEPTASLSEDDARNLFRVIRELRGDGVGIVYISHRLEELATLADRVTVLRDGATVDTRPIEGVTRADLIRMMVGRELSAVFPKRTVAIGEPVLELRGVGSAAAGVRDIDLVVRAGEIVGLAGLVGAGRSELADVIFGLSPADVGSIRFRGREVAIGDPAAAIRLGIGYVPEDRRRHGVIPGMSIASNVTLGSLPRFSRHGRVDTREENRVAAGFVRDLSIRTPSVFAPVSELSGGNQQKVALSRWLVTPPALLILDEPTQGIDVGAKAEIHALMSELAARGAAILMISSELPEVLAMSDRIAVMRERTIVDLLDRSEATQERILASALGHRDADVAAGGSR